MENKKIQIVAGVLIVLAVVAGLLVALSSKKKGHGGTAAAGDSLNRPRGLALDASGKLYIADSKNNRVQVQDASGKVLRAIGGVEGSANGQFREDCGLALAKDGRLVVADTFHTLDPKGGLPWGRVQVFSPEGKFKLAFGDNGQGSFGTLFGPRGVAVDSEGSLWLSDTGNHRLLKFSAKGDFLMPLGQRGKGKGQFIEPFGLAVDSADNIYVADRLNYRIQVFGKDGSFKREFKSLGWEENQACEPYLAIDNTRGLLYATDTTKNLVHRYKLDGSGHKAIPTADGVAFNGPTGIAVRPSDGTVFVANAGNGSIVTFKP
jgi:DNA-binding beta-propeller fold protein YncE